VRPGLFDLLEMPSWMTWFRDRSRVGIFKPLDEIVERLIERGTTGGLAHEDLLARLLAARDAETGLGMTHREVRDQVATIFMAGHETTALALTWTWYLLALHPAVEAKFHDEIDRVLAGRAPRFEDLALLPYTRMVLEESMRLYPPAHTITRRALADDEIGGRKIPRGTTVFIVPWVIHRHHALWDRPEIFDPERFTPEKAAARPRFAYLPFGGGPRICIGATFAMTEAIIILAMLGQRYRLRLAPGEPVEPVGLITLRPRHGLRMTIEPR
jgi:cytochrome P450